MCDDGETPGSLITAVNWGITCTMTTLTALPPFASEKDCNMVKESEALHCALANFLTF
jgi:hypothetical protein